MLLGDKLMGSINEPSRQTFAYCQSTWPNSRECVCSTGGDKYRDGWIYICMYVYGMAEELAVYGLCIHMSD